MRTTKSEVLWPAPPGKGLTDEQVEAWIEEHDPCRIHIKWELIDGKHEAVDIRLERPSGTPIKASEIHAIPFGKVFGLATAYWGHAVRFWPEEEQRQFIEQWHDGGVRLGRPRKFGPEHWLRVAEVYTEAKASGKKLRRTICSEFGCSDATARNWITQIRKMGLANYGFVTEQADTATATGFVTPPSTESSDGAARPNRHGQGEQ